MHHNNRQEEERQENISQMAWGYFNTTEGWFFKINGWLQNTPDRLLTLPE